MATGYTQAVRRGTLAAARLHQKLDSRRQIELRGGGIDVFGIYRTIDLPLLVRPLQGLLGAYLEAPIPGILVTSQRRLNIQRFTAAHELGHFSLHHRPSFDDARILRRMFGNGNLAYDFQEMEADAFAVELMLPRWLIHWHMIRQGWTVDDLQQPNNVYQLALRIGASYEATCRTLVRHHLIAADLVRVLLKTQPRALKIALLQAYRPQDYRGDVWLLTERDAGTRLDGSRDDHFILRLEEHGCSGYVWDVDQLKTSGFGIVQDALEAVDDEEIGSPVIRRVTAILPDLCRGHMSLDEKRPWDSESPRSNFEIDCDFTGPEEEGYSRAERRYLLEAV